MKAAAIAAAALIAASTATMAASGHDSVLAALADAAKSADPGFVGFSAEAGQALFLATHEGGKPDTPSCTTCHTRDPTKTGMTRAGKTIDPLAASANPKRFTDMAQVEKWFGRNCNSVLGRDCTPKEKGDFATWMISK